MVVHDADEAVLGQAAVSEEPTALVLGKDLLGDFEVERVPDLLPDLLRATSVVVLEAFKMQDQHLRKGLDGYLLCGVAARAAGRVEFPVEGLGAR